MSNKNHTPLTLDNLREGERVLKICNSCRYCEGLCPVFPEMTRYRNFKSNEVLYLANLCHNCKGCYHGCQYAEPHEFNVNVPRVFSLLRQDTFSHYTFPAKMGRVFFHNGTIISILLVLVIFLTFLLGFSLNGVGLFEPQRGEGSFFRVIPLWLMSGIPSAITAWAMFSFFMSVKRYSQDLGLKLGHFFRFTAWKKTFLDVATLKHLSGGTKEVGCTHTDEKRSQARKWFHQLTFYGFVLCFFSTSLAFFYHHFLGIISPYPFTSAPVLSGIIGGIGLIIGPIGLIYVKLKADSRPVAQQLLGMEYAFIHLLFSISLTGLVLMVLRETFLMPSLLCLHLGFVFTFFLILPYSKFMHVFYRLLAIFKMHSH